MGVLTVGCVGSGCSSSLVRGSREGGWGSGHWGDSGKQLQAPPGRRGWEGATQWEEVTLMDTTGQRGAAAIQPTREGPPLFPQGVIYEPVLKEPTGLSR